ncbi:DUF454 domain-containing protein [Alteromonadaceae bacterium M269]|nr:DUF454 domain-containing protein [Alteromonadaceae bacterium M269]
MILYRFLGYFFVALGGIGVVLPLLPTTPFILVAAGCFARSSPRCHQWLLNNKVFGPMIVDWQEHQCISAKTKVVAVSSMIVFGGYSVFFAMPTLTFKIIGALLVLTGLVSVLRLKTCTGCRQAEAS